VNRDIARPVFQQRTSLPNRDIRSEAGKARVAKICDEEQVRSFVSNGLGPLLITGFCDQKIVGFGTVEGKAAGVWARRLPSARDLVELVFIQNCSAQTEDTVPQNSHWRTWRKGQKTDED
jgi:hypothetical protein